MSENTSRQDQDDPLREYARQYRDGVLSAEETVELERRLHDDPDATEAFVLYMLVHAQLAWNMGANAGRDCDIRFEASGAGRGEIAATADGPGRADEALPSHPPTVAIAPAVHSLSFILHPLDSFGSVVLSYLVAAMLSAAGILAAWKWQTVERPQLTAANSTRPSDRRGVEVLPRAATVARQPIVGRVTRMADCRLADKDGPVQVGEAVPLGRRYALLSGVLEISYAIGPKVIVEGPAEYEVDSPASGFLHIGKLTLKMGVKPGDGKTNRPFFCVHTPRKGKTPDHPVRNAFRTQEMDLMVTVQKTADPQDKWGDTQVLTFAPAAISASVDSKPVGSVALPDVPGTVVGIAAAEGKQQPVFSVTRGGASESLADAKRRREKESGYAQDTPGKKKQGEQGPAKEPKS